MSCPILEYPINTDRLGEIRLVQGGTGRGGVGWGGIGSFHRDWDRWMSKVSRDPVVLGDRFGLEPVKRRHRKVPLGIELGGPGSNWGRVSSFIQRSQTAPPSPLFIQKETLRQKINLHPSQNKLPEKILSESLSPTRRPRTPCPLPSGPRFCRPKTRRVVRERKVLTPTQEGPRGEGPTEDKTDQGPLSLS